MNIKLNAGQLRKQSEQFLEHKESVARNEIYIILDNILDTYNIGSIFRLADAVAAKKVILCGGSVTPPNHRILKASINTTEWVPWEYFETTKQAIQNLRSTVDSIQIVAVELDERAVPYDSLEYKLPVALVVGHETEGISQEAMDLCDATVQLPMYGVNISLNVMVSLGIVLYKVIEKTMTRAHQ